MEFLDVTITDVLQAAGAVIASSLLILQGRENRMLLAALEQLASNERDRLQLERSQLIMENQPRLEVTSDSSFNGTDWYIVLANNGKSLRKLEYKVMSGANDIDVVFETRDFVLEGGSVIVRVTDRTSTKSATWSIMLNFTDWHHHRYFQSMFTIGVDRVVKVSQPNYIEEALSRPLRERSF